MSERVHSIKLKFKGERTKKKRNMRMEETMAPAHDDARKTTTRHPIHGFYR